MADRFFHGTDAQLASGDHVIPAAERNPADPRAAQAHAAIDEKFPYNNSSPERTFMSVSRREAARWGRNVYEVIPVGRMFQDWNGGDGDYEVDGHLIVTAGPLGIFAAPPSGGSMPISRIDAVTEAIHTNLAGYTPANADELNEFILGLQKIPWAMIEALGSTADVWDGEFIPDEVVAYLREHLSDYQLAAESAETLYARHKPIHDYWTARDRSG